MFQCAVVHRRTQTCNLDGYLGVLDDITGDFVLIFIFVDI